VIPDKATNSLTIRDTAENVRLIEDILRSLDKDRAEVVMDVNIYEVSSEDVFQLGNQVGAADSGAVLTLGTASSLSTIAGSRQVATQVANLPTALGAALILPQSQFIALQRKGNTRLLASTQVHAFTGEESTARIGQRVPVQTAQTYPVGNYGTTPTTGGTGGTTSGVFGGGFPVIQYEPTGLTLKFTPIVFPNLDVQVKMSIESKDVLNASLTPTFTERTISGTARVQNNRTMMLASVAQDRASDGRQGIPFLGLVPILGRLFTAPRRDNTRTDVVIAVTPRVLRAPSLTPEDERPRESGTLSTPTAGSLEALVQEATREEQLAAARKIPTNPVVQLPDSDIASYIPAPAPPANSPAATIKTETSAPSAISKAFDTSYKPAPGSSLADKLAATVGTSNDKVNNVSETAKPANGSGASLADKIRAATDLTGTVSTVSEIKLLPERNEFKVGEKQRVAVTLSTSQALGPLMLKLTFDPRTITVKDVIAGEPATSSSPTVMKSIDPKGSITVAVSPQSGVISATGSTFLLFLDIEAVGTGDATLSFDKASSRITLSQGGEASSQLGEVHILVK